MLLAELVFSKTQANGKQLLPSYPQVNRRTKTYSASLAYRLLVARTYGSNRSQTGSNCLRQIKFPHRHFSSHAIRPQPAVNGRPPPHPATLGHIAGDVACHGGQCVQPMPRSMLRHAGGSAAGNGCRVAAVVAYRSASMAGGYAACYHAHPCRSLPHRLNQPRNILSLPHRTLPIHCSRASSPRTIVAILSLSHARTNRTSPGRPIRGRIRDWANVTLPAVYMRYVYTDCIYARPSDRRSLLWSIAACGQCGARATPHRNSGPAVARCFRALCQACRGDAALVTDISALKAAHFPRKARLRPPESLPYAGDVFARA